MIALVDAIGDRRKSKSKGCVATTHMASGVFHVGGLTVFGLGSKTVNGVIEGVPKTANRQNARRKESESSFHDWGCRQLKQIIDSELDQAVKCEALMRLWDIGIDIIGQDYLSTYVNDIILITDIAVTESSVIFVRTDNYFYQERVGQIGNSLTIGSNFELSFNVSYALGLNYGDIRSGYRTIDLAKNREDLDKRTAYGRLLNVIIACGFDFDVFGPENFEIGKYIGPDGGVGRLKDPNLRNNDPIFAHGILIRVKRRIEDGLTERS